MGPRVSAERADAARTTMTALTSSHDVFETFFDHARIGLALADLSTNYVRVNRTYAQLMGRAPEDLVGVPFSQMLHPDDRSGEDLRTTLLLSGREHALTAEQRYVSASGTVTWVLHGVTVVPGPDGRAAWFAVSAQDITERRKAEEELRELTAVMTERAVRDPLTGLANRALFEERLRSVLARDGRTGDTTGLLFLDLDGFKAVNDDHGHAVGDAVLRAIAGRLRAAVRPSDTAARLGGDEFVVLVESTDEHGIDALVGRLAASLGVPLKIGDLELAVGVSIGRALAVGGQTDPAALVAHADRAMYDVKRLGRPVQTGHPVDGDPAPVSADPS
jgi:diguanylate cyclase (GGDEF)-like protein/PAS domain S-box-containing protein